jgi:Ca-activated chloride channel family protein
MTASCVGVYLLVPVGHAAEPEAAVDAAIAVDPADDADVPEVEEPASLIVEARVGHDHLKSSGDRRTYVMVELRGKEDVVGGSLQTSTALVIDTSGSMMGIRMSQAEEASRRWVQRAPDGDFVTVIGFAQQAQDLVPRVKLTPSSRAVVLSKLAKIPAAGDTCMSCGVERALATVADPERIQRVVVLSDGRANVGLRDVAGARLLAAACRDRGISVSTIGLGTGYNEKVLSALAFDANGLHHFVQNAQDLPKVFEREERTLRATVASGARATVELAPGVQLVQVLDRQYRQTGQQVTVEVGPIAAGASRTVLMEVRVPGSLGDTPVATARVSFRDVAVSDSSERTLERKLSTKVGKVQAALDGLVAMRLERAHTGVALQRAADLFSEGRKQEALDLLDQRVSALGTRSVALPAQAQNRGDRRANDIQRDLRRQIEQADRARKSFRKARPKAAAPVKQAAPMVHEAFL